MSRTTIFTPRNIIWGTLLVSLVVVALREQLRLPAEERTWHGRIAGRIPYDFRLPTAQRIRAAYWNKQTAEILVPQPFGIGWTINLYPLLHASRIPKSPTRERGDITLGFPVPGAQVSNWRESLSKEREIPKSRVDAVKFLTLTANSRIIAAAE
jgi:hypothetical protein